MEYPRYFIHRRGKHDVVITISRPNGLGNYTHLKDVFLDPQPGIDSHQIDERDFTIGCLSDKYREITKEELLLLLL